MSRKVDQLLGELGYKLDYTVSDKTRCDLRRGKEHWTGEGGNADEALQDVLHKACPSALSWTLLQKALREPAVESSSRRDSTARVREASTKGPPRLVGYDASRPDLEASLEELDILKERVGECRDELGLFSPERQRHAMLAWICEARGHTDHFGHDPRVRDRVAAISRLLTDIGKAFWPGSVVALQLNMEPSELPRHILGGRANTWTRAADLAEAALHQIERGDQRRGLDGAGWADIDRKQHGVPQHPGALMDKLVAEVEEVGGKLGRQAAARRLPTGPQFLRWVRMLRWLRTTGHRPDLWCLLAGRFRWWASRRDADLEDGARELDATFRPDAPWHATLEEPIAPYSEVQAHKALSQNLNGQNVLLVSPRWDRTVFDALGEVLPQTEFTFSLSESERLTQAARDIESGSFHLVLAGLGFQGRKADRQLALACASKEVRYVRAPSGDLGGYLRGLLRTFAD